MRGHYWGMLKGVGDIEGVIKAIDVLSGDGLGG